MEHLNENRGVAGYQQPKKRKDYNPYPQGEQLLGQGGDDYLSSLRRGVDIGGDYIRESQRRWNEWSPENGEQTLLNRQKESLFPKDSEERRRRSFVTAPNVVNEAIDEYYNNTFRPNFESVRKSADDRAFEAYKRNVVPGANPFTALGAMRRETDPQKMLDEAMYMPDDGRLDEIAQRYAGYAGLDPDVYRRTVLEPAIRNRAVGDLVESSTPKSSVEYLGRQAWKKSLFGGLTDLALQGYSGTNNHRFIDDAAMENYNPSRAERWGAGVGGLLLDSGVFSGIGSAASSVTKLTTTFLKNRAVSQMIAKGAGTVSREAAEQAVKKSMVNSLGAKILQSSMNQGLTLGAYDAAHSVVNDLLHGESVDAGAATSAFAHGAATGAMLGVAGTPLREISRGLTGGKKIAASAGVLSAESAVFTASTQLSKAASGAEIEPIDLVYDFGESMATLLAMRMSHWRPSGGDAKLNSVGRLKSELRFSQPEAEEIAGNGVNPDAFITNLERSLNVYQKNSERSAEEVRNDYLRLMSSSDLSAATRAKLLFLVENKLSSTPPAVVDYSISPRKEGGYNFVTLDAEGRKIDTRVCMDKESVKSALFICTGDVRRNRIAENERLLMQNYDSQNFFRQAGKYALETGTKVDVISDAMYKKANGEPLTATEQGIMDDILQRSNYKDNEVAQMLYGIRRNLEVEYGLKEGSLLAAVNKSTFHCSPKENEALNAYEKRIESEVHALYDGVSQSRAMELSADGRRFAGLGNEELKKAEGESYVTNAIRTGEGLNEGSIPTITEKYGLFANDLRQPEDWNNEFVWNTRRHKHRKSDIEKMGDEVTELARRLGCDVELIRNEKEISELDAEYSDKVRSLGWFDEHNDRIVINLPNNANVKEAKVTVVHEVVGHRGLAGLFGNYYYDFLEEVYTRGSDEVRSAIEYQASRKGGSYHAGVDEYLAILSEKTYTTPEQRSLLQRLRDFVRDMLQRFNIYKGRITEHDLTSLIQRHHSAILEGKSPDSYRRKAFTPFETAWRGDGGYYNDRVAWERYNRYMKQNPDLDGLAPGFHDFKRRIYGGEDTYDDNKQTHHRYIGETGVEEFDKISPGHKENLEHAKDYDSHSHRRFRVKYMHNWEKSPYGEWRTFIPYQVDEVKLKDYIHRTLKVLDQKRASEYFQIMCKPEKKRTEKEKEFLEKCLFVASQFDDHVVLDDIVVDEMLYKVYPGIDKIPVVFHNLNDRLSFYDAENKVIVVDKRGFLIPKELKFSLMSTMYHVVQERESYNLQPVYKDELIYQLSKIYAEARYQRSLLPLFEKKDANTGEKISDFEKLYGISIYDFKEKYPTLESFLKDYMGNEWPDKGGKMFYNVSTTTDEMKKFLLGPLDIIDESVAKIKNRAKANAPSGITLSEAERLRREQMELEEIERRRLGKPARGEEDILAEFERIYGQKR